MARPLVVAAGNPMAGDDGLGYCVGRVLEDCVESRDFDVLVLTALDPGVAAYLEGRDRVVFVDAVDPSSLPGGARLAVYELDPGRLSLEELTEALLDVSSHEPNPVNILLVARASGVFSGRAALVGLRVWRVELGSGLSREACGLLEKGAREVLRVIGSGARLDTSCVTRVARRECGCESL